MSGPFLVGPWSPVLPVDSVSVMSKVFRGYDMSGDRVTGVLPPLSGMDAISVVSLHHTGMVSCHTFSLPLLSPVMATLMAIPDLGCVPIDLLRLGLIWILGSMLSFR